MVMSVRNLMIYASRFAALLDNGVKNGMDEENMFVIDGTIFIKKCYISLFLTDYDMSRLFLMGVKSAFKK